MRGLSVSVYRNTEFSDCTNGGVTSREDSLILFGIEDGCWKPEEVAHKDGKLLLVKRDKVHLRGYLYAVPAVVIDGKVVAKPLPDGWVGWMAGGNYVGTSDSRFSESVTSLGAIPVHDRAESYEHYRALTV